jgi:hypothetical protein
VWAGEGRTVGELLNDSDGLAREALLDMSADRTLGMVRGWPQLVQSAAELWAVLPPDPTILASADPIAILAAMGRAVDRSLTAGHWPGRGPKDEAWEQIASIFVQARRLLEEQSALSEAVSTDGQIGLATAKTQMLHALYVAAHATSVALTGYQHDLHHRLEVGARRRQPFVERPTALEVDSAQAMIARFDAIEQLAAGYLAAPWSTTANQPATGRPRAATRLEAALAVWEIQAHRTLANHPDAADLVRVARVQALIATTTVVVGEAAARLGEIDAGVIKRLTPALENTELAWSRSARRGQSSPRRPVAPIQRWLRRPASFGPPSAQQLPARPGGRHRMRSPAGLIYLQPLWPCTAACLPASSWLTSAVRSQLFTLVWLLLPG